MNVIYALWMRQLRRYARSKARILGTLGQPILFLFALGFGLGHVYETAIGGNYIDFIAPGVISMSTLFAAMFGGIELIWDRQFGFLKETLVAPVSRLTIMTGRTLGGATVAFIQGMLVFVIALIGGFRPEITLLPLAAVFLALIAIMFTAVGTAIATKMTDMQAFPIIINFVLMPLFFLSGALFPLEGAPQFLVWISILDPLTYGVDGLRIALGGAGYFSIWMDLVIMLACTLAALRWGTRSFEKIEA